MKFGRARAGPPFRPPTCAPQGNGGGVFTGVFRLRRLGGSPACGFFLAMLGIILRGE